jgi:DNA adenine methylase
LWGANLIDKVPTTFQRIGIDYSHYVIQALIAIRDLVDKLPDSLTEEEYKQLKVCNLKPIKSWLRFVASFCGKFDNGYARTIKDEKSSNNKIRNYVKEGKRSAQKQSPKLQGVEFVHGNYEDYLYFENCLIYCDPPYEGTTHYKTGTFDHKKFWDWCRLISKNNSVFISEYRAPEDFICVWSGELKTNFASQRKEATNKATEKLFKLT